MNSYFNFLKIKKIDALLISRPSSVSYVSGFTGEDSWILLIRPERKFLLTDFRFAEQAGKQAGKFEIVCCENGIVRGLKKILKQNYVKKIGFEDAYMSCKQAAIIKKTTKCKLVPIGDFLDDKRKIKKPAEIELIKQSAKIASLAMSKALKIIKPGMTENELSGFIEWQMKKDGASSRAFPTIVASGPNAAMPHAAASLKKIKMKELILIDCGCVFCGYNSDLTRTTFLGRIDAQYNYIYNIVKTAQLKAIDCVKPGIKACDIDKAARAYIESKGMGRFFGHSTGHGVGISIHERPRISSKNTEKIKKGMVFTVEPGIYIPGWGGVRIEDTILVSEKSRVVLTEVRK